MKNFKHEGNALDCIAPAGGVTAGKPVKIGDTIVVPSSNAAEGEAFAGWTEGVYEVATDVGTEWAPLTKVYLKADGTVFTQTAAGNTKAGVVEGGKAAAAAVANVRLVLSI